ncbi:LuxR family transcriptional regulator [Pandoraea eparura]|uniref:LuxR family transcriptional regulator n=1 Tax=Pandoraea eparura TaxID=2508291 RepID=A0A5E4RPV9_9BURK|nr:LuxR C-terminal-related transcriptional regulator [Pandoraea eparura]VVD64432.1 LuxR family transcriptional regulator [Pandoraea eparura]
MDDMTAGALASEPIDYEQVFANVPVALMVTRRRVICACNKQFLDMFRTSGDAVIGQSVRVLYPNQVAFDRFGARVIPALKKFGRIMEPRAMQRLDGQLFWVNVTGVSEHRDDPYREALWFFSEMGASISLSGGASAANKRLAETKHSMTKRERDVAALLIQNQTAKEIGIALGISPRTVEVFRGKLLKKFDVPTTHELVKTLLA